MELQEVPIRFEGEEVATVRSADTTHTLYRTPEGRYIVYTDEAGGEAWLEAGSHNPGFTAPQVLLLWPEFAEAVGL